MSFSQERYKALGSRAFFSKVIRRTLLIFLLGYLMYWFPFFRLNDAHQVIAAPISHTRIMGVLQRIALCYFFASLILYFFSARKAFIISVLLLIGTTWILLLLFGDPAQPFGMLTNAGTYLDKFLMGDNHLYHGEGVAFDPEGWLSTLPAIVNVVAGVFCGLVDPATRQGLQYHCAIIAVRCAADIYCACGGQAWFSPSTKNYGPAPSFY